MRSLARTIPSLAWLALGACTSGSSAPSPQPVPVAVAGDASPTGIFDPSVVSAGGGEAWMAYSSVDYHGDPLVQDVGIAIARSTDGGLSWTRASTVASPSDANVTDPDTTNHTLCGSATCSGRWVYETSWLVDDATDVAARRWKLFAHQYFLHPGSTPATFYHLGAIVMWAAASPDQLGASAPATALRWGFTPASFTGGVNVNALHPDLSSCLALAEGGATAFPDRLDLVVTCPYPAAGANPMPQKIVLLRSADHAASFQYVATVLSPSDASGVPGASFFTAPSLLPSAGADPVLIVTPSVSGRYAGCEVIPFADEGAGTLSRGGDGKPRITSSVSIAPTVFGGACAYDRGLERMGLLSSEVDLSQSPPTFRILRTGQVP